MEETKMNQYRSLKTIFGAHIRKSQEAAVVTDRQKREEELKHQRELFEIIDDYVEQA